MPVICEFYNQDGQKIITQDSVQMVCVAKVSGTTARRPGWATNYIKTFDNSPTGGLLYAVVSDQPVIINPLLRISGKLNVASAFGVVANFTVYIFNNIRNLNLDPSPHGAGIELYDVNGKVIYSTAQRHMKIATAGTILHSSVSFNIAPSYALCIPENPFNSRYTGNPNGPEGARVYWEKRGYSYNRSTGACTSAMITEFQSNESVYPAAPVNSPNQVPWLLVDTATIDAYMPTITS